MKVKNGRRLGKMLFVLLLVVSMAGVLPFSVDRVQAQDDYIEAGIYPSEGTGATEIVIRFYTRNASIGNVETADLFWDGVVIGLNMAGNRSADGSYNYGLSVPLERPLSDIGNHTIMASSSVFNYGLVRFNFTFVIIEFVPSPEYSALNMTYHFLLANYTALLNNYTSLSSNYTTLVANYDSLFDEHGDLLADYTALSANYNSLTAVYNALSANYNSLLTNYNQLHLLYASFLANYTRLVQIQNSLNSIHNSLKDDYASLESSYESLKTDYHAVVGEQTTIRRLSYIFIVSTIILTATTVYLAFRPKLPRKAR